ncbi:MAG: DNA replication/repair protein RecF [Thermoanaerobacteraceae bacterium]|nr:DNA replication/repair protein RecF [Thermoanaerobacteraceae bacterium]
MYIKEIELNNYRNFKHFILNLDMGINIILGKNAAGKTNILESIYLLSRGKSFRTSRLNELINHEENNFFVGIRALRKSGEFLARFGYSDDGKKQIKINGMDIGKISELLGNIYTILFTPEDLYIVKGNPEQRRNFIDEALLQLRPNYTYDLMRYYRVLKQRNNLLKNIAKKPSLRYTLNSWDEQITEYGIKLASMRSRFVDILASTAAEIHKNLSGGEKLDIKYMVNFGNNIDSYRDLMRESIDRDIAYGLTTIGPHRDDIKILLDGRNVKSFSSQGQQRTIALSLKLSEIRIIQDEIGESPIFLLDDVFSELDDDRKGYILENINGIQSIITANEVHVHGDWNAIKLGVI